MLLLVCMFDAVKILAVKIMAFQFDKADVSVQEGFRRIAIERIDAALTQAQGAPDPAGVHAVRKDIKKLRGLLRLVRPRFRGYEKANALLRHAAAQLAPLRDAEVRLATLDSLIPHADSTHDPAPIRAHLEAEVTRLRDPALMAEATGALRQSLAELREQAPGWRLKKREFAALEEGLGDTWRRARLDLKAARRAFGGKFDAAPFHSWRRSVKHHWYQARLLQPVWPEIMAAHVTVVDELGEVLGDHNDLDVLAVTLAREMPDALSGQVAALVDAALARRRVLAGQALVQGRRLLAEPPEALCARWGQWWALWRD